VPKSIPRQIQYTPLTLKHLSTEEGVHFLNLQLSQIVDAINKGNGTAGQVVLKSGVDVAGSTVTGLGAPSDPTDAVSLAHANSNYAAPAVGQQLDLGGSSTLKGLSGLYLMMGESFTGTIIIPKLSIANGSITVVGGLVTKVVQPT